MCTYLINMQHTCFEELQEIYKHLQVISMWIVLNNGALTKNFHYSFIH